MVPDWRRPTPRPRRWIASWPGCAPAPGDRYDALTINILLQHLSVTARPAATRDALARLGDDWEVAPADLADSPLILVGTVDEIAAQIVARRERWGITSYTVFAPVLDAFVPVIDAVRRQTALTVPGQTTAADCRAV